MVGNGTGLMMIVMFALLFLGVPIGISLGISIVVLITINPVTTQTFVAQSMFTGCLSFIMLALPFFIVSGNLMAEGGLSKRLVRVANALVGNVTGSLGMVTVIGCMFFGAISGSAPATVAAIGAIMIPMMIEEGYDKYYATALTAVAGGLGIIVPPSYPMVLYGVTNNVSIASMFLAGVGPAALVALVLIVINYFICKKAGYKGEHKFNLREACAAIWNAKLSLLMPVIVLGGIYGGVFTATEASVVATVYSIVVGGLVYRELKFKQLWKSFYDTTAFIGGTMFTYVPAASLGSIFTLLGVPTALCAFFFSISSETWVIMLMIYVILFIAGMFVQTNAIVMILSPMLLVVAQQAGVNAIQFGIVVVLALAIAFMTPPVALNLFVSSQMTGLSVTRIAKTAVPFLIGLFIVLIICGAVPEVSCFLLDVAGHRY